MTGGNHQVPKGRTKVTCWCEAQFGYVDLSELRQGRTFSCGRPACQPATHTVGMADATPAPCTCQTEVDEVTKVRRRVHDPECPLHKRHREPEVR